MHFLKDVLTGPTASCLFNFRKMTVSYLYAIEAVDTTCFKVVA